MSDFHRHGIGRVSIPDNELTLAMLDLQFDEISKFYEAPFQMKAKAWANYFVKL